MQTCLINCEDDDNIRLSHGKAMQVIQDALAPVQETAEKPEKMQAPGRNLRLPSIVYRVCGQEPVDLIY